jgi:uncharacterized protein (UPF0332 family)
MSFDWSGYLAIAEKSYSDASVETDSLLVEAHCRCAISRAYYSVFNVSYRKLLANWGSAAAQGGEKHGWTIERYNNYHSPDAAKQTAYRKVGVDLDRLRVYRNNADYDDILTASPSKRAEIVIKMSHRILNNLSQN